MDPGAVSLGPLVLVVAFGAACAAVTVALWDRLQLTR